MSPRSVLLPLLTGLALLMAASVWSAPTEKQRTDRYGDPLPPGAVARMGSVLFYHGSACTRLAFSPDGKILAVSGGGGDTFNIFFPFETRNSIRLLDVTSGRQVRQLQGHSETKHLCFSLDGKRLFSKGSDEGVSSIIKIWDVDTGKELHRMRGQTLSHDGKTLLRLVRGKDEAALHFVNIATGKEFRRISVPSTMRSWFQLAFAPDDKTLAGDVGGSIYIWDATTGKVLHQLAGIPKVVVNRLAYSPTGETLLARFVGGTAKLWDSATGKELHQWDKSMGFGGFNSGYSPDGKTLAGAGQNKTIQLWDVKTGKQTRRIKTADDSHLGLEFSPDGKKLAWGSWRSVHLWDLTENKEVYPSARLPVPVEVVAFSADGKTLLTSGRQSEPVRSWEIATGKELGKVKRPNSYRPPVFSTSGRLFAVRGEKLRLFDRTTEKEIAFRGDFPKETTLMVFSPDGQTLAVGTEEAKEAVQLWDTTTGRKLRSLEEGAGGRLGLSFTDDGKTLLELIVGPSGPRIQFWDMANGKLRRNVRALGIPPAASLLPGDRLGCAALSPNGRLVAWVVRKPEDQEGIFLKDVRILLWDLYKGEQLHELRADISPISHLAFSPDNRSLACDYAAGGVISLWEVATGQERQRFEGHRQVIDCLAFSADGSLLSSGARDHTAMVWDVFGRLDNGPPGKVDLSAEQLRSLWTDLRAKDARVAYRAMCRLMSGKQTVPFLKTQLQPVAALDARQRKQVSQWIADLDSAQFETRQKAARELEKLGDLAEPALRAALANKPSLEVRNRIKPILEKLEPSRLPQRMQALRAIEVLEHIATSEALELLRTLADGAPSHRLTREAKTTLQRLAQSSPRSGEGR